MADEVKRGTLSPCNVRAQGVTSDVIYSALSLWTGSLFLIRILFPNLTKTIQAVRYDVIYRIFPLAAVAGALALCIAGPPGLFYPRWVMPCWLIC